MIWFRFLRRSGGGGWSGRAIAQRGPRFTKSGLKELFDYYSNEIAVEAARQGASGRIKGLLSRNIYSERESWTTALSLTKQGQNAVLQRKIPLIRKSYLI
jgi:hypothetical protein